MDQNGSFLVPGINLHHPIFFLNNGKNRFYLETIAIGEKRPQYKIGLNSEYSMDKWGFIAGAG